MRQNHDLRSKILDELKALMSIIPVTLEQVEKICETIEKTLYKHPELELKIKKYLAIKVQRCYLAHLLCQKGQDQ